MPSVLTLTTYHFVMMYTWQKCVFYEFLVVIVYVYPNQHDVTVDMLRSSKTKQKVAIMLEC